VEEGKWKDETKPLEKEEIRHILGTLQVSKFNGWKEEVDKYLMS
jgi:hypothetical protein